MRRALLLFSSALAVIPGGIELAEEAVCLALEGLALEGLALEGHGGEAHAGEGGCAEECGESGCRPGSHACSCCAVVRVAPSEAPVRVPSAPEAGVLEWPARDGAERPSYTRDVSRPPRA